MTMNLPSATHQPLSSDLGEAMEFIRNVPIFSDIESGELAKIVRVGVPIQILGLEIAPGDLLHGDENGLMKIPSAAAPGVEQAVQQVRARERRLMDFMRSPEFSVEKLKGRFME